MCGALRGMGKQTISTILIFISFYFVGNPISVFLGFYKGLGLSGITIGFISGSLTMGILIFITITWVSDWEGIS
jgi:multidrug resistance protein, MATE family